MWPSALGIITVNLPGVVACVLLLATLALAASAWRSLTTKHAAELQHQPEAETEQETESLRLFATDEIKRRALSCGRAECAQAAGSSTASCAHYRALLAYLEDFLAKPHADVGRAGPVCPFVPLSLKKQTVLVGMVRTEQTANGSPFGVDEMVALMRRQRERFLQMEPTSGRMKLYKAMVIGFPDVADEDAPKLIDRVQRQLKSELTQSGMMIGEFHRQNKTPGLRNAAFCPLQTPVPALAIRFMVPTDVLFLKHDAAYLEAYLSTIPDSPTNAPYRAEAHQAMQEIHGHGDHGQPVESSINSIQDV